MSLQPAGLDQALTPSTPDLRKAFETRAYQALSLGFQAVLDPRDQWGLTVVVAPDKIRRAVEFLRTSPDFQMDTLVELTAIDYLGYPGHQEARFAVVYLLRSLRLPGQRLRLKVWVEEDSPEVPSIHDQYAIADWQEREAWDQYGIVFTGHPDLRRLLNHVEFVGHPLRKDYPAQKRQWLSTNDPLIEPLENRLRAKGFQVLSAPQVDSPSVEETDLLKRPPVLRKNNTGRKS